MKFKLLTVSMPLLLMLTACNQTEKYEGYTPVESDTKSQKLYINASTVKQAPNGVVSFSMIIDSGENHIIQTPTTDCIHKLTTLEDFNSGEKAEKKHDKISINTVTLSNKDNSEITKIACEKVVENRIIKGNFNDSTALEILYGNYDVAIKTSTWKKIEPPSSFNGYEKFNGKDGSVKVLESKDFTQDKNVKHILITETSFSESSDVLLSATIFLNKDNNWIIEKENFYLIAVDGAIKAAHWQNIGKRNYGIVVEKETNDTNDNNAFLFDINKSSTLVEFDSTNDVSLTFEDTEQDYPDLIITNRVDETESKNIYHYTNGKYELLGTESLKKLRAQFVEELRKNNRTKIWFEQDFKIGSDNFHVTFTKTSASENGDFEDCHACAPKIGAVTYRNENNEWKLISKQNNFGELGQYGDAPVQEQKIQKYPLKNEKIVFLLNDGYGNMGEFNTGKDVLMFINNNWSIKGYITTNEEGGSVDDNEDDSINKYWKYDGKILKIKSEKEYPDFEVIETGTIYDDSKSRITTPDNSRYTFNGKEYIKIADPIISNEPIENDINNQQPIVSDDSKASSLVIEMMNYAMNDGGENNDSKIEETKRKIEDFPKLIVTNKKEARTLNDQGLELSKIGNLEGAVKLFEDAHKLNPADIEILNNLGFSQMKLGNLDEAQKAIITVLAMTPSRSVAWNTLGDIFAHKGEVKRSIACFYNYLKFSKDKSKSLQVMKKLNEKENDLNLKTARINAIDFAENRSSLLNKDLSTKSKLLTTNEDTASLCEGIALKDSYAVDFNYDGSLMKLNTDSILKEGQKLNEITQYLVNSETHESMACQNNGYCYVANKNLNGDIDQTIQFTNCNVGVKYPHQQGDNKNVNAYQLKLDRSKFSDEFLAEYDLKTKLHQKGLDFYVLDNAIPFAIKNPNSTCASYVNKSLEGNADAINNLTLNSSNYCNDSFIGEKEISHILEMANAYYKGIGTSKNIQEAIKLYKKAALQDNKESKDMLEKIYLGFLYRKDGYWSQKESFNGMCQSLISNIVGPIGFQFFTPDSFSIFSVPGDLYPNTYFPNGKSAIDVLLNTAKVIVRSEIKVTGYDPFRFDLTGYSSKNGNVIVQYYEMDENGDFIIEYKPMFCKICDVETKKLYSSDNARDYKDKEYGSHWCKGNIEYRTR
jgi:tetratricopeptide (TPR) repeat protein